MGVDEIDRRIMGLLMEDARKKLVDIAEVCGMSSTAVKSRIRKLEQKGVIVKRVWNVDWSLFGYSIPVTIGVNLIPKVEGEVCQLVGKKVMVMGVDHFLGAYDLFIFAFAENNEELKELELNLRNHEGVYNVELNIWNRNKINFKINLSNEKQRLERLDSTDIQIFKKLLENPEKPFLQIAEDIGIAPITAQRRYEKMEKAGFLKPSIVVDYSKMGYPLKACFTIKNSPHSNPDPTFKALEKTPNIFLSAETIGSFDIIALGLFRDLNDVRNTKRKIRTLPNTQSVTTSITDETDFPFKREYNPSQIFTLKKTKTLQKNP